MKRDMTVWVGSAWWRNSEPHTCVCALTAKGAEDALEDAMKQAAEDAMDSADDLDTCEFCDDDDHKGDVDCALDAQAWSGAGPESLRSILDNTRSIMDGGARGRYERREIIEGLRSSGVAYLETP